MPSVFEENAQATAPTVLGGHDDVLSLMLHGDQLLSGSNENTIKVWNIQMAAAVSSTAWQQQQQQQSGSGYTYPIHATVGLCAPLAVAFRLHNPPTASKMHLVPNPGPGASTA
jgi:hypothetical protein